MPVCRLYCIPSIYSIDHSLGRFTPFKSGHIAQRRPVYPERVRQCRAPYRFRSAPTVDNCRRVDMTDCAKYLNGRGIGARFDGTFSLGFTVHGSCAGRKGLGSAFTRGFKDFVRKTWEVQVSYLPCVCLLRIRKRAAGLCGRGRQSSLTNGRTLLAPGWLDSAEPHCAAHNFPTICG